jgi:hypothetical protein
LADRLFDPIGGDDDFRQLIGASAECGRRRKDGERQNGPTRGPQYGFEHGSSSRPTDGG